jgi:hypothetical protein
MPFLDPAPPVRMLYAEKENDMNRGVKKVPEVFLSPD